MDGAGQGQTPDHGGGIDAAAARFGGARSDWIDLSTGINPVPYPLPSFPPDAWTALPDRAAGEALDAAARRLWQAPPDSALIAAAGVSALIARIPALAPPARVAIPGPTYNEHARAFRLAGWEVVTDGPAEARVVVHPNNPDGHRWTTDAACDGLAPRGLLVLDESFADAAPGEALAGLISRPNTLVLKGLGKFWGLAGLRLGFALGDPALVARMSELLGPWPVSGPALVAGTAALKDLAWAEATRSRLGADAGRLDGLMASRGARLLGGTTLFRLYEVDNARSWQERLAQSRIWTRAFPYNPCWLRLGLPAPEAWPRLEAAL